MHERWHARRNPVYEHAVTIDIRRLWPHDAQAYRRLRLAALTQAPDAFGSEHDIEAERPQVDFEERLATTVGFGAWDGAALLAMANYQRGHRAKERHKATVHGVFVERQWRGHGLATRVLSALIDHARRELEQLTLSVVAGNDEAFMLYRRFGFEVYGVEPRARKTETGYIDQILMILLLTKEAEAVAAP